MEGEGETLEGTSLLKLMCTYIIIIQRVELYQNIKFERRILF